MRLAKLVVAMIFISSTFSVFAEMTRYTITELDVYSVVAVNNSGQVTGRVTDNNKQLAFVTDKSGNMITLEQAGGIGSTPVDINDRGQVAGYYFDTNWDWCSYRAFVTDSNNNMIDLGLGQPTAINSSGQVTGVVLFPGGLGSHAFVTDSNNNVIDLGTLGTGRHSKGFDINDSGQVVGRSEIDSNTRDDYAFVTDSNFNMVALTNPNSGARIPGFARFINNNSLIAGMDYVIDSNGAKTEYPSFIDGINDSDQLIGTGLDSDSYQYAYVVDSEGNLTNLGTLGGRVSTAHAINSSGQVVGSSSVISYDDVHAFITDSNNNMIELSTLVDDFSDNWEYLYRAIDISDTGYIIGSGKSKNGDTVHYLLTPSADTAEPIITSGPAITAMRDTIATVTWQTDEPASSSVAYGVGDLLDNSASTPGYTTDHRVHLTGLSAETQYSVKVNSIDEAGNGPTYSDVITFTTTDVSQSNIINISTRANVAGGQDDVYAGFVVYGTEPKRVIIRGLSVKNDVNPTLRLLEHFSKDEVGQNDDWQDSENSEDILALPSHLQLRSTTDAGLLLDLKPGVYDVVLSSVGSQGLGIVSVDEVPITEASQSSLINISTRANIGGGQNDVYAGFVIEGSMPKRVILRGLSASDGVNPTIRLLEHSSKVEVGQNDDWENSENADEILDLPKHLQLRKATDAGLLLYLRPGVYDVVLSSMGATGLGVVSVDEVPVE